VQFHSQAAEFVDESEAFFAPLGEVRRGGFGFGGARKEEVTDLEIADGATEIRGARVEFSTEEE